MADRISKSVVSIFLQQLIMETTFMFAVLTLAKVPAEISEENDNTEGHASESLSGECVIGEETGSGECVIDEETGSGECVVDEETGSGECVADEEISSEEIESKFTGNPVSENQNLQKRSRDSDNEASRLGYLIKVAKTYITVSIMIKSILLRQIGHDYYESEDRKRVVEELSKLPGLSSRDLLRVATRITTNQAVVHLFLSLSDGEKGEMVEMMLDGAM